MKTREAGLRSRRSGGFETSCGWSESVTSAVAARSATLRLSACIGLVTVLVAAGARPVSGQVIEFESGGLTYQAQTRGGLTIMVAPLPTRILGYAIVQVAVSNGSVLALTVRPEDFRFLRPTGGVVSAISANAVVNDVFSRAGRSDVSRLITVYESALYGNAQVHSTNGYDRRRKDAMSIGSTKLRAAATASAVVLGAHKLEPGQSTDGAVFFPTANQPLGAGKIRIETFGEVFEFTIEALPEPVR